MRDISAQSVDAQGASKQPYDPNVNQNFTNSDSHHHWKLAHSIEPQHHIMIWVVALLIVATSAFLSLNITSKGLLGEGYSRTAGGLGSKYQTPSQCHDQKDLDNPSDLCKVALVHQLQKQLQTQSSNSYDRLIAFLSKTEGFETRTENYLSKNSANNLDTSTLSRIRANLATLKASSNTLNKSLPKAKNSIQTFLSLASDDPLKAYSYMKGNPQVKTVAANYNSLLEAVDNLSKILS